MTVALADYRMAARAEALTLSVAAATATFSRATTATYHSVGLFVQTAGIDVARTAHYVGAVNTPLYESAAENLLRRSEAFDNAAWDEVSGAGAASGIVADSVSSPSLALTADTVGAAHQLWTPATTGAHTFSLYVKDNGAAITDLQLKGKTDPTSGVSTTLLALRLTWAAGVPTASIFGGFGTLLTTVALSGAWYRVSGYATVGTHAYYTADVQNSGGTCYCWGAQVEAGTAATSYIPTTATTATRAGDGGVYGATATGYTRAAGSFITDGYRPGMELAPVGFTSTTRRVVTAVSALDLTVNTTTLAVQAIAPGRTLAVGMPSTRTYENLDAASSIVAPAPWTAEKFLPGTTVQDTIGPLGWLEITALYQVDFHVTHDAGPEALDRYADALTVLLAPRASMTTDDGTIVRVLGAIQRSPILPSEKAGYSSVSLSFPLRVWTPNTI